MVARANLKALRKARGLTQRQLAEKIGVTSKSYVSMLERGQLDCSLKTALRIEVWSQGEIPAISLLSADQADLMRRSRGSPAKAAELALTT